MSTIKTRLHHAREKFLRRSSASIASSAGSDSQRDGPLKAPASTLRKSISLSRLPEAEASKAETGEAGETGETGDDCYCRQVAPAAAAATDLDQRRHRSRHSATTTSTNTTNTTTTATTATTTTTTTTTTTPSPSVTPACPAVTLEEPADLPRQPPTPSPSSAASSDHPSELAPRSPSSRTSSRLTPPALTRRPSATDAADAKVATTLLVPGASHAAVQTRLSTATAHLGHSMPHRKIWVKRPNASATLVQIREDDLVDDVRDMILKKYSNSLGRSFDAPDVTLRIIPRDSARASERTLGPEEDMCRTLDSYFPGGQLVTDALVIDVPQRRTPKPSPQVPVYYKHHDDHTNHHTEYFPPMPVINPSPAAMGADPRLPLPHTHAISVINTGQLPPLPSPGGRVARGLQHSRPKYPRHNTTSPTTLTGGIPSSATSARPPNRPRHDSSASETKHSATSNNPIPTPPVPVDASARQSSNPPTPRVASPQPNNITKKRRKKQIMEPPSLSSGLLDGSVPPINVLIVEDNMINLRVLGAFMQRLKVRWQRAMNGKEAVTKWKAGGFHLVLMDIQLPVMNGLEATKEIRRLERVNSIGVFSSGSNEAPNTRLEQDGNGPEEPQEDDKLGDKGLFKSPVIIVALTASSLQSDRHEALAAGCNDFLTKPVNFVWLERKVKEWGCMQALIDFDGWRKWKDFADNSEPMDAKSKMSASFSSIAPPKKKDTNPTLAANPPDGSGMSVNGIKKEEDKEKKSKRKSVGVVPPPTLMEDSETGTPDGTDGSGT